MARSKKPAPKKRKSPKPVKRAAGRKPAAAPKRGVHDLGGLPGGPIDRSPHELTPFEERVDALMMVLTVQQGIAQVDSMRRTIESFTSKDYQNLAYYEKWIEGLRRILVEREVLTDAEIEAKIADIRKRLRTGGAA